MTQDEMELFKGLPVIAFASSDVWRDWLHDHHATSKGIWLRIFKAGSGQLTVTYAEALDEALCYGWIDSTKNSYDADSFLQRFSPRKARSPWSKVNREHIARLTEAGKIHASGLAAVEDAKRNGEWEAAYDSQKRSTVPEDFQTLLDANPEARDFFQSLNSANRYAFLYRIQKCKTPEMRAKKIAWSLDKLLNRESLH
ncbi:MAG TPA: YdeI/OmpD-associated family protein [Oscillatoriaceae cyanobacterium]